MSQPRDVANVIDTVVDAHGNIGNCGINNNNNNNNNITNNNITITTLPIPDVSWDVVISRYQANSPATENPH